ncbi:MAG: SDR family oxidoreductase [Dehalococcoidia bacterium]
MERIADIFDLSGHGAVVTGAAKGIGLAIARRLAEAGAGVVLTDVDETGLQAGAAAIVASGGKAEALVADAASTADARRAVELVLDRFGRLDILVNNAGIFPMQPALAITEASWDRVLNLNLRGAFFWTQAAADAMISGGRGGRIINIASIDALHPTGRLAHYDASKGGMVMLTKSLALEFAPHGIRVNAIAPGGVATPGVVALMPTMLPPGVTAEQASQGMLQRIPLRRMGDPDDIALVTLFLATDASAYVTGEVIVADGGYLLS